MNKHKCLMSVVNEDVDGGAYPFRACLNKACVNPYHMLDYDPASYGSSPNKQVKNESEAGEKDEKVKAGKKDLGIEALRAELDDLGVAYKKIMGKEKLAELLSAANADN